MKHYLAAPYCRRNDMQRYAQALIDTGHQVTSHWHDGHQQDQQDDPQEWPCFAEEDLEDIRRADRLLLFNRQGFPTKAGKDVEFGYALARRTKIVVLEERSNPFTYLECVCFYPSFYHYLDTITTEG